MILCQRIFLKTNNVKINNNFTSNFYSIKEDFIKRKILNDNCNLIITLGNVKYIFFYIIIYKRQINYFL